MEIILSVVVCTCNRALLLKKCLESLECQTLDKKTYEVIIIDNNSNDNTQEIIKSFIYNNSNFRSLVEYNQGLSHARNRGYKEAKGKYVAYIDDDAIANEDWCKKIIYAFETVKPAPAAVGGTIYPYYDEEKPEWFLDEFEIRQWGESAGFLEEPRAKYGFSGSNMTFPREVLIKYGGFSINFGMVKGNLRMGEDTELFSRIYPDNPYFWYDPEIQVRHWTPKKNMEFAYKFQRSLNAGISSDLMMNYENCTNKFKMCAQILVLFVHLSKQILCYLKHLLLKEENWKTTTMRYICYIGNLCGTIIGKYRRLLKL